MMQRFGDRRAGFPACWLALFMMIAACSDEAPEAQPVLDVLIRGGTVYDGSTRDGKVANIGLLGNRIAAFDPANDAAANVVIDAAGYAVTPGFIDPHTHALADLENPVTSANLNYLAQGVTTVFVGNDGAGIAHRAATLRTLQAQGIGSNVAFYAGHGDLRRRVMGLENRVATPAELDSMQALLATEMDAGALGLSTGLYYTPGSFASTDEVIALASVAAARGGIYDTHMRSESSAAPGLGNSVKEVLDIARGAHIAVHISHLKALGRDVWGQSGDIIAMIDAARASGLQVTANQYPYRASGTSFSSALVPQWARADSRDAMLKRFDNPDLASRLHAEMSDNLRIRGGAEAMLVIAPDSEWRGLTLADIAERLENDALEAAVAVIRAGDPSIASFVMEDGDIAAIAIQPWVMTGSDGSDGHPRKYGTYPTVYRDLVVERSLLRTPQFVHRSAGLVADTFGLCDRGYLAAGRRADIVVLDPERYRPLADFEHPEQLATGVVQLFVNGIWVIRDGNYTGELPGDVIDKQALACPD